MKRWPVLILLPTLSAVAALAQEAEEEAEEKPARVCVGVRSITSFDAIDDEHVYIKASANKHYLFTMQRRCFGLRNAQGIAVKDTMSRVCSGGFGEIVYRDMGRRLESCRVSTVEAVASKEDAKGLVSDRKQAKQQEKDAEE